jgi:hypothetical protein
MQSEVQRLKLAYFSPLPPKRSGISDYSAELLPELYRYYDIDVVVDQETVSDQWIIDHCGIINLQTFRSNSDDYDRVLYHFGNSQFHSYMFGILLEVPGVVVFYNSHPSDTDEDNDAGSLAGSAGNQMILDYAKGVIVHPEVATKQYVRVIEEYYTKNAPSREGLTELKARITDLEAKIEEVEKKANEARDHYFHISNSFSYQITKPLRTVRGFIKKGTE